MKNKVFSVLLSVAIAFGMWYYVITVDSPEYTDTIYGIPVTLVSETALQERGLMIVASTVSDVDMTVTGNRSDVLKLNRSNITLRADLSRLYDPGVHNIEYTTIFPGDVASNAFTVENQYPSTLSITLEKRERKEIDVKVVFTGAIPEGYFADTENMVRDYTTVVVTGPASVVERIDHARIEVNLDDQRESINQSYRYTLCDLEGNPVDAEMIEVNVEEIHLDVKIQAFKDVALVINVIDGGGATSQTAVLEYDPRYIKVSGSEVLLAELDQIVLGTINLAEQLKDTELTFTIPELEGITNLSEITEITAKLSFPTLSTKEFTVEEMGMINVPEGMEATLITEKLAVKVRGPSSVINSLTAENIKADVDFTDAQIGTSTFKVIVSFGAGYENVGAVGTYNVPATVSQG